MVQEHLYQSPSSHQNSSTKPCAANTQQLCNHNGTTNLATTCNNTTMHACTLTTVTSYTTVPLPVPPFTIVPTEPNTPHRHFTHSDTISSTTSSTQHHSLVTPALLTTLTPYAIQSWLQTHQTLSRASNEFKLGIIWGEEQIVSSLKHFIIVN